jgi:hypothetical protein
VDNSVSIESIILNLPYGKHDLQNSKLDGSMKSPKSNEDTKHSNSKPKVHRLTGMRQRIQLLRTSNSNRSLSSVSSEPSFNSSVPVSLGHWSDASAEPLYKTKMMKSDSALSI